MIESRAHEGLVGGAIHDCLHVAEAAKAKATVIVTLDLIRTSAGLSLAGLSRRRIPGSDRIAYWAEFPEAKGLKLVDESNTSTPSARLSPLTTK